MIEHSEEMSGEIFHHRRKQQVIAFSFHMISFEITLDCLSSP